MAPFYSDWTFWSFVVAAVAIVLSQLPPLRTFWLRSRLESEAYGRLMVTHLMGYPNMDGTLGLRNSGGKPLRVHSISLNVTQAGKLVATLVGAAYHPTPQSDTVILTPFILRPGEEWIHGVHFFQHLNQNADRELGQLRAEVRRDINFKLNVRNDAGEDSSAPVEVDAKLAERLDKEFTQNFRWFPGEYEVEFRVETDQLGSQTFRRRFTLYESDERLMRDAAARHRFGFGVIPGVNDPEGGNVWVDLNRSTNS